MTEVQVPRHCLIKAPAGGCPCVCGYPTDDHPKSYGGRSIHACTGCGMRWIGALRDADAVPDPHEQPLPTASDEAARLTAAPGCEEFIRHLEQGMQGDAHAMGTGMPMPVVAVPRDQYEQQLPTEGRQDVQEALIEHIRQRREIGVQRYGTPLQTFNGRDGLRDALEEALDLATYLMQVRMEVEEQARMLYKAGKLLMTAESMDLDALEEAQWQQDVADWTSWWCGWVTPAPSREE